MLSSIRKGEEYEIRNNQYIKEMEKTPNSILQKINISDKIMCGNEKE